MEHFGAFRTFLCSRMKKTRKQENQEKSGINTGQRQALELTPSPYEVMRWIFTLGAPEKNLKITMEWRQVQKRRGRLALY